MRLARISIVVAFGIAGSLLAGITAAGPAAAHTLALYPTVYTLTVRNESKSPTDIAVYQTDPGFSAAATPLVWQDVPVKANAETGLSWNSDYSLSWSNSADLKPGAVYRPDQTLSVSAGAARENAVELIDTHGDLGMHRVRPSEQADGALSLQALSTIPPGSASVALGMSGRPASVVKAEPDQTLRFTPHPTYWITAGTFTEGEVINPRNVADPLRLHFGDTGAITVTFHQGGHWTVS